MFQFFYDSKGYGKVERGKFLKTPQINVISIGQGVLLSVRIKEIGL